MGAIGKGPVSSEKPSGFSDRAAEYVGGGIDVDRVFSPKDLAYIKSHLTETNKPLYRVEDAKFTADRLTGGDFEFSGSFRSFSRDWDVMRRVLDEDSDEYAAIPNPVIFEIVGNKKHFDMEPYTQAYANQFGSQSESLVNGKFEKIEETKRKVSGQEVRVIRIRQK